MTKGDVRILEIIDEPDINGVYNAKVEIFNPNTQKWEIKRTQDGNKNTMFPKDWDDDRIKEEIKSAWDSNDFGITNDDVNGKSWTGTSKSGVEIKGFINKEKNGDKVIEKITAFPLYKGEL